MKKQPTTRRPQTSPRTLSTTELAIVQGGKDKDKHPYLEIHLEDIIITSPTISG